MAKWEMDYSPYGPPGRPRAQHAHQEYPAMYYKVRRSYSNGSFVVEHYIAADDENMARNLESRGYVRGRREAELAVEAQEQRDAVASAERAYSDQHMSGKAKEEIAIAEAATSKHLPEVPVTPIRKHGPSVKETKADLVEK